MFIIGKFHMFWNFSKGIFLGIAQKLHSLAIFLFYILFEILVCFATSTVTQNSPKIYLKFSSKITKFPKIFSSDFFKIFPKTSTNFNKDILNTFSRFLRIVFNFSLNFTKNYFKFLSPNSLNDLHVSSTFQ